MEKKTSNFTYGLKLTIILVFFAILCFPLTLMLLDGPDEYDPEAFQETDVQLVPLNWENYISGTFHSSFEGWFSKHYPFRSNVVTTYKEMIFNIENSKPAISVMTMLGSFGSLYLPEGSSTNPPDPDNGGYLPDVGPGDGNGSGSQDGNEDGGNQGGEVVTDPWAIYLDPNNIYADINKKQMADTPVEPAGFKGDNKVYIGKSGYLFESSYIDEYLGFTEPYTSVTQEGVQMTVDRLEYIQKELKDRYDITMIYVLSSSKASQYAAYIPDYYKISHVAAANYVRPVDMLRPLLAKSSINYLDSSAYYQQIGLLVTFPKTGIHWNGLSSFETTAKLMRMYADISGDYVKLPKAVGYETSTTPYNAGSSDADVFSILYGAMGDVAGKIMDDAYYYPKVEVENSDAAPINVFIQGGSFTHSFVHHMGKYGLANVRQIYYNGHSGGGSWDANANPWVQGINAWESILPNYDMILFEQTEQQIRGVHITDGNWNNQGSGYIGSNAVYDSLYEYLKSTEK